MPLVNVPESKLSERNGANVSRKLEAETLEVYTIGLLQARAFVARDWDVGESRDWDRIFEGKL